MDRTLTSDFMTDRKISKCTVLSDLSESGTYGQVMKLRVQCNDDKKTICVYKPTESSTNRILDAVEYETEKTVGAELELELNEYQPGKHNIKVKSIKTQISIEN